MSTESLQINPDLLSLINSEDVFRPQAPASIKDTGLSPTYVEALLCKHLGVNGSASGRQLSQNSCLPFAMVTEIMNSLRRRQLVVHSNSNMFNDYEYSLTEAGRARTQAMHRESSYAGPAPVTLTDYILSVEAQSIANESPDESRLRKACRGISVEPHLLESIGPAFNSGAGLFLFGAPGNGKTTLAIHLTKCFGQHILVPHAILEGGQLIKFFDPQFHKPAEADGGLPLRTDNCDARWIKIQRPTVVVGGELTMEDLEISYRGGGNVGEAPLQLKSNCGCLLIDDFGRQRVAPQDLLNRWIVPLESQRDFLTLVNGKKIQVPFEQLIIFSTNLVPEDLVDEAFLRRIPYKIEMDDPSDDEFHHLFKLYCESFDCEYRKDVINYLIETHYNSVGRAKRRCHPRDLLKQVRSYCRYNNLPLEVRPEHFDTVARSYFAMVLKA